MKPLIIFLILALSSSLFAQNTYLKITEEGKPSISYPPGTKFELKNEHNYTVLKDNKTLRIFNIGGEYTLTVFPDYKKEKDVYKLSQGKIELFEVAFDENKPRYNSKWQSNGVTAESIITDSKIKKGQKNILFKLNNGIIFKYTDGKYNAYLDIEENHLNIKGKYLVESEQGTLKLSFNPKDGETWWVFEPIK